MITFSGADNGAYSVADPGFALGGAKNLVGGDSRGSYLCQNERILTLWGEGLPLDPAMMLVGMVVREASIYPLSVVRY